MVLEYIVPILWLVAGVLLAATKEDLFRLSRKVARVLGWISVIGALLLGLNNIFNKGADKETDLYKSSGTLQPPSHEALPVLEHRILAVGHAWYYFTADHDTLFKDGDDLLLGLAIQDGELTISATIRNPDGSLVAKIRDNKWMPSPESPDWNYRDDLIEIYDRNNNIVLQVVHLDDVISLQAILRTASGWTWGLGFQSIDGVSVPPTGMLRWPTSREPMLHIEPICKEVGAEDLGNCPGYQRLREIVEAGRSTPIKLELSDAIDLAGPDTTGIDWSDPKMIIMQASYLEDERSQPVLQPTFETPRPVTTSIITEGYIHRKRLSLDQVRFLVRVKCPTLIFANYAMGLIFDSEHNAMYQSTGIIPVITPTTPQLMVFENIKQPIEIADEIIEAHAPDFPRGMFEIGQEDASYIALFYYSPKNEPVCMKHFIQITDQNISVLPGPVMLVGELAE